MLGPADLAFTPEECAAVLALRSGRAPADAEVEEVWTATEGWPLAVALTAGSAGAARARITEASLFAFLDEEVLEPAAPALRDALVDSALAPELDPALLTALGLPPGLPREAVRAGLPLLRLEPEPAAVRPPPARARVPPRPLRREPPGGAAP